MLFLKLLLIELLCINLITMAFFIDENVENKWPNLFYYQLSDNITSLHYDVKVTLTPNNMSGESNITFYITCPTPYIILNIPRFMNIDDIRLKSIENGMICSINNLMHIIDENRPFKGKLLFIESVNELMPQKYLERGIYTLHLKFSCTTIRDTMDVLQTFYRKKDKSRGFIFATIHPKRARQLFPCLDEPTLRATFNISVEHHTKYKVLSNMPIREYKSVSDSMMCTVFQMTPLMSIYEVAIIMSDLHQILNSTETVVNTWCRQHLILNMTFAQYVAGNVTKYLENNFKILKKIPKVDYVAIPNLKVRIKQTWGLVFYNETDIIYNEELYPTSYKTTIMRSVTRDIIHQWFGNIFKPFCRSHRLLNEGFIMFLEIHVIEKVFPDSQITDLLIVQTQQDALYLNSYTAMNFFAKDTSSISEIYSHFSFSHMIGTALWRMLNSILPRNLLWINLNEYLNTRFTYSNSTPNDLWSLIQTDIDRKLKNKLYNNLNIKQIMNIWTTQTSCPVVNVIRDYSHKYVKISKEIDGKLDRKPYFIPVSYTKETNIDFVNISPQRFDYLTQSNPEIKIDYDNEDKWFIANILQTGYYRVNYDIKNWQMIARYLNSKKYSNIHVINRAQIIDDAFHLAIGKKLDFSIFWELANYLWRESNYVAWYPMIKIFERISSAFALSTTHEYFEEIKIIIGSLFNYVDKNMYNQTKSITILNDNLAKHLKQELTKWGCLINNFLCLEMAKEQYEWHLKNNKTNKLLPEWKKLIFCNSLKTANYSAWNKALMNALNAYKKTSDYEMLKVLSCSDDPQIVSNYIWFILKTFEITIRFDRNIDFKTLTRKKEHLYAITADIFLSTLAIHVKNPIVLNNTLKIFENITNSRISTIATLIVIINNVYSKNELDKIKKFAKNMPQLFSIHMFQCIEHKITTRLLKIESQIEMYQTMFSPLYFITTTTIRPTTAHSIESPKNITMKPGKPSRRWS